VSINILSSILPVTIKSAICSFILKFGLRLTLPVTNNSSAASKTFLLIFCLIAGLVISIGILEPSSVLGLAPNTSSIFDSIP